MNTRLDNQLKKLKEAETSLSIKVLDRIERLAKKVLTAHSELKSFDMSMGTWCIWKKDGHRAYGWGDFYEGYEWYGNNPIGIGPSLVQISDSVRPYMTKLGLEMYNLIEKYDEIIQITSHKLHVEKDTKGFKIERTI